MIIVENVKDMKGNNEKIFKISLFFLGFVVIFSCGINSTFAANSSSIYVSPQGNDTWDGQSIAYNGTSGPKQTITNAIGTVANNGTIYLASGTYNESDITINTNMTIIGENQQNTIIDAQGQNFIFFIEPIEDNQISLTLVNLTLQNGNNIFGGAIWNAASGSVLNITNITFTNNTADAGGAIYNNGNLTENNDTFNNNTATSISFGGGAIYNFGDGTVTDTNDTFNNNIASNYGEGGAIDNSGIITSINDTFNNNIATNSLGGAIYNDGNLTETNNIFNNNTSVYGEGGAIYNDGNLTETNNIFNNNTVNGYGGAIYNYGTVTETNDIFINNTAGTAGAIFNNGNLTETNDTFINNTAGTAGAIFNCISVTGVKDIFINNTATYDYGGAIYNIHTLTVTDSEFLNNTANVDGGAIYNAISCILTITNDTFNNNIPNQDNLLPTVNITDPLNDTYVHNIVPINVIATDTVGVTKVVFTINGNNYTGTDGADGWSYNWNTKGITDGIYNVTATVYDSINNSQNQTISVNVENTIPTTNVNINGGYYNTTENVTLFMSEAGNIYYTLNGTTPTNTSTLYNGPITVSKNTTLKYIAIDQAGNISSVYTQTYTIDKTIPTASASVKGGLYNTNKVITLTMSEPGKIYYTLNGSTPTTKSMLYTKPITITSTTTLKYIAIDLANNKSATYIQNYVIDKTAPKVVKTTPTNSATKASLTTPITINFSENILKGNTYNNIYIKNVQTGKVVAITKTISKNTLTIKMTKNRLHNDTYIIYIPKDAFKDQAGNLTAAYSFRFKTG